MRMPHVATILALMATPAAHAQNAPKWFFESDMVRGAQPSDGPICAMTSQFKHNEMVVFRIRVTDPTGKNIDNKGLKSLVVELANGQKIDARFHGHPPKDATDFFWVAPWIIPADFPTGTLSYKVIATDASGATQTWQPFKVQPSQFTVLAGNFEPPKK
ncbi:MAG TPA: hypothetical protein VL993_06700 [Stellaceae bacterium]|nr:hypothetical protein [Stellaceae bacterium]